MSWWVGAYIEAGASVSGNSGTAYLPFVFQADNKTAAQKAAGAKLLAGPFSAQQQAQNWATSYERNPNTLHSGSGLSKNTGTTTGDNPPAGIGSVLDFLNGLTSANLWIRVTKVGIGGLILIVGLAKLTSFNSSVAQKAFKVAPFL
jgi:hypothetical protein